MVGLCRSLGLTQSCLGSLLLTECLLSLGGKDSEVKLQVFIRQHLSALPEVQMGLEFMACAAVISAPTCSGTEE